MLTYSTGVYHLASFRVCVFCRLHWARCPRSPYSRRITEIELCDENVNFFVKAVVYQENVLSEDGAPYSYIGLTENMFKRRWSNHCQSFKNELSNLIGRLKRENVNYATDWQILTKWLIQAWCEVVQLVPDRKTTHHEKAHLHQQPRYWALLKKVLDIALLLIFEGASCSLYSFEENIFVSKFTVYSSCVPDDLLCIKLKVEQSFWSCFTLYYNNIY